MRTIPISRGGIGGRKGSALSRPSRSASRTAVSYTMPTPIPEATSSMMKSMLLVVISGTACTPIPCR